MRTLTKDTLVSLRAVETLCGSGRPAVEVTAVSESGHTATGSSPSGTSCGGFEAKEMLDGGERYRGYGVRKAVENINTIIAPELRGASLGTISALDDILLKLDGTSDKSALGANAILAVSVALTKLCAHIAKQPVYTYLCDDQYQSLPVPMATVIAGGTYSSSQLDFEDYLLIMHGFDLFSDAVERLAEIRKILQEILFRRQGSIIEVGGALAPDISSTPQAFDLMLEAVEKAGCGGKVGLGLDVAANELFIPEDNRYRLGNKHLSPEELCREYEELTSSYPLLFIEDPYQENDFENTRRLRSVLAKTTIVGDDLFASNPGRIAEGADTPAADALLLKINQIGSVSEALQAARVARRRNMKIAVSLRSNDTGDDFIADFAVAVGAEFIKLGSPVRGERNVKYNRLLTIEDQLGPETALWAIEKGGIDEA